MPTTSRVGRTWPKERCLWQQHSESCDLHSPLPLFSGDTEELPPEFGFDRPKGWENSSRLLEGGYNPVYMFMTHFIADFWF